VFDFVEETDSLKRNAFYDRLCQLILMFLRTLKQDCWASEYKKESAGSIVLPLAEERAKKYGPSTDLLLHTSQWGVGNGGSVSQSMSG
jgi:hypothetical protein